MMKIERLNENSAAFMHAISQLMPQLSDASNIPSQHEIDNIIASAGCTIWIAYSPMQEIVGMLTLAIYATPSGIHAWIEDVVVDQNHRTQGYGEALTDNAIKYARQQGAKAISLTSRPQRQAANRLYRRMGFKLRETNLYRMDLS